MASVKNRACRDRLEKYKAEVKTKDRLLASISKISGLLNRPIQGEKILHQLVKNEAGLRPQTGRHLSHQPQREPVGSQVRCRVQPGKVEQAFTYPLDMNTHQCRETLVAKTGRMIYIRDARRSSVITEFDFKMDRIWRRTSSISMPLKIKGEIIGVLQGDSTTKELVFSQSDIKDVRVL